MSSVRWVHRKGQNCEKRVISLNEIKERYLNDAANQRKDRRNEKPFRDGINADTGGKKGKKKLITFYEKKAEKTANQQRGLSEKNVSIHFGKKKYCCSGEKGETKNGCSGCGGNVAPPGGQHGQHGAFGSAIDMGRAAIGGICGIGGTATIGRPLGGGSNPGPPHHAQPQVNINLDVNIQWNKQNGKIEKDICHVGGTSTFHGEKRTWHPTEGDREGNTEDDGEGNIRVPISEKRSGENGNWSDSPVGTAYPLSSEEVLLRGAKQQKEYEQDRKKKKKIILSINKISNILKKKILKYLTRWREHSIVRPPRPVYKKYSKIVSPTENHHGGKNGGSLTALSGHTTQSAFPRRVDMPLLSFQRVPKGGNYPERGIPNPLGGGVPQGGSKEETSLRVNTEETIPKSELSHCNESGVPPFAKKNSKECLKVYRQLSQRKVLTNTLIDSFNDVDIHDQRKKKKYLKFFSILLCLFLRRHMHRQLSVFFSEEKRSIRKFINSRVYAVTILEGALKRREKKKALRQLALLEREKRGGREDKQTLHHYGDHPIESNSTEESSVLKSAPHPVEPSHRDNSLHDHRVADCTEENEPKLTPSRSHEKPCFGKPKIFRTDDFAMFFKKKILKEKDDILQKCLLRSKSDAVLDFLKMSRMENFSKKATCSSAVLNFPDAVYYNEDMRSSTLLDRFFTATYSPEVHTGHHHPHRDKIHLSFYEHMSDNCTMVRSSVDYHHSQNKRETYMHFKRECFETGGGNSTDSARQSGTGGKERLPTSVADAINTAGAKVGSTSDVMNKLGCLIGDSNFLSGVTAGGGNQMDDSSEEDVNDKRCRMFFKQFKKQLTMKCREAAPGEELRGDDRHSGEDHLGEADEAQNGLSLSDLNSTVGVSKDGATYT
ncbi:hypothetical protein PVMG_03100 [Plasmodium vivax Mauritania I]|uniref:Uncharacterized protein n=1 Tax=Plasmodium vivax Mauritania I TaxID=1035515 RepID=A0A0J9W1H5_PLAVI|nr:hypothetical protein PVMG_03100 [Plasmodium vivax Mauritania I]